jgi:pSer/pThr/pTyr-binding forkhead associated (FHA) protein
MAKEQKSDTATGTVIDARLAPRRLKEGLVPSDTGIYLRVEEGPGPRDTYTLSAGGVYLIGRKGADIVLEDEKVSRKHAEIGLYGPGAYVLRDLASTNGTLINGRRIGEKAKLQHWDLIRVGDTELRFAVVDRAVDLS